MAEATARPWRASNVYHDGAARSVNIGADSCEWRIGELRCVTPNDFKHNFRADNEREKRLIADVAFVVRAVNAHEDLLAALQAIADGAYDNAHDPKAAAKIAAAAITKALGG